MRHVIKAALMVALALLLTFAVAKGFELNVKMHANRDAARW